MGGWEMVTHHIAAFVSVFVTAFYREAHPYTLALLSTECTTPFINIRWLLEKMVRPLAWVAHFIWQPVIVSEAGVPLYFDPQM